MGGSAAAIILNIALLSPYKETIIRLLACDSPLGDEALSVRDAYANVLGKP